MFGFIVIREKRLDQIISDAVGKATGVGFRVGFEQAIILANNVLLKCGVSIEKMPQTPSLVEKQIEIILEQEEKENA